MICIDEWKLSNRDLSIPSNIPFPPLFHFNVILFLYTKHEGYMLYWMRKTRERKKSNRDFTISSNIHSSIFSFQFHFMPVY